MAKLGGHDLEGRVGGRPGRRTVDEEPARLLDLPRDVQEKFPLIPTLARPVQHALPARIQQRFHLWLDGFDPPSPEESWWKKDYDEALAKDPRLKELAGQSEAMKKSVNTDIWFDKLAFQPAQAIFGIASG